MSAPVMLTRIKAVVEALSGHSFTGLRNAQIAEAVQQAQPTTYRDLLALEAIGWVERIPGRDEYWRLAPGLVQIALAHQAEVAREHQRLADFTHRYSRLPN